LLLLKNGNLITAGEDNFFKIWDKKFKCIKSFDTGHTLIIRNIIQLKSKLLACGSDDKKISIFNDKGKIVQTLTGNLILIKKTIKSTWISYMKKMENYCPVETTRNCLFGNNQSF
jgi:WD40 repeat protein